MQTSVSPTFAKTGLALSNSYQIAIKPGVGVILEFFARIGNSMPDQNYMSTRIIIVTLNHVLICAVICKLR